MTAKNNAFRQQELLQELFDLDRAFEASKIKQAEYRQRRAKGCLRVIIFAGAVNYPAAKKGCFFASSMARLRTLMSSEIAEQIVRSGGKGVS